MSIDSIILSYSNGNHSELKITTAKKIKKKERTNTTITAATTTKSQQKKKRPVWFARNV